MRGSNKINHKPFLPINRQNELKIPYICRMAPFSTGLEFEWFDYGCDGEHTVYFGKKGEETKTALKIRESIAVLEGLEENTHYEMYIESETGGRSKTRLFRTGEIPEGCSVINYLHPEDPYYDLSGRFLGTPSMVRTDSGKLIASMDVFESFKPQNLAILFYSEDDGKSWRYLTDLFPYFWTTLFYRKGILYALGVTTEYGDLHIACSKDEGETWSEAKTIFRGSNFSCKYGGVHKPPMQIVPYKGRLYLPCEYGCWEYGSHLPAIISISEDDDLMVPENWIMSDILPFEGEWKEKANGEQKDTIEGNIVVAPDGNLYSFMRWSVGAFLKLKINTDNPEKAPEFVDIVEAPVSNSIFRIIPKDGKYLMITNRRTEKSLKHDYWTYRNVLSVYESEDLESFTFVKDIFNREDEHPGKNGFQYPNFILEGDEILLMVRAAFNEPDNAHNSNHMLFCKVEV